MSLSNKKAEQVFFALIRAGLWDFIKRKTNKLLIPFAFWYIFFSVGLSLFLFHMFGVTMSRANNFTLASALYEFWTRENFPNAAIWFLLCLFLVNIHFYFIHWVASRVRLNKVFVIGSLSMIWGVGLALWALKINLPAYIDTSFTAVPFFCFGYMIKEYTSVLKPNRYDRYLLWSSLALFVTLALFCVTILALHIAASYSLRQNLFSVSSALYAYPCGFVGTLAVILFAKKVKKIPVVSMLGRYSIMI